MSDRPYVIGLTGNIATGKSTVGRLLTDLGAQHIDADKLAHQVMAQGTPAWEQIVAAFGQEILLSNGSIDRRALGDIVFTDVDALARLEAIVHPRVIDGARQLIQDSAASVMVIEAIKLIESGMAAQLCDALWVVVALRAAQIERLIEQRGLSHAEAALRVDAQPPQEVKAAQAGVVIKNNGSLAELIYQVEQAWRAMKEEQRWM